MGLSCGAQCSKYILFVFNVIFWLSGIVFIAAGAYVALSNDLKLLGNALETGDNHLKIGAYTLIVIGVIVFVVGFCGCCGAIKENQCLLGTYIALLAIILIASLAIGIYAAVKRDSVTEALKKQFKKRIEKDYPPASAGDKTGANFKKMIDELQVEGKCCGVDGKSDWKNSKWYKDSDKKKLFPPSCCGSLNSTYAGCTGGQTAYTTKCADYIESTIRRLAPILIGIACGVAALEIFGIIFACCLCRSIRHEYDA